MRMFVAVELDDATRAAVIAEQQRALTQSRARSSLRLVDSLQIHLTLAFLGEVAPPLSDQVVDAMRQPIPGIAPFRLAIGGLGMFPPRGAPHVLWLGIATGTREIVALQSVLARRLNALGVDLEDRPFRPHVTIGRWKHARPSDRISGADADSREAVAAMTVDRVTLFESRLSSQGASHHPLAQALLAHTR
jgi:2'-5' RNA ligase